jgi:DNA-binding response OmpR family regulator
VRILLVEDEPAAARVLAKGLREHAYAVDIAGDGPAALLQTSMTDYDLIILDVMLPGQDGLSVCRALRESGSTVPVIMLTARDTVEARVRGLDVGADDYLPKPYDFRELLARMRALVRRGRRSILPERLSVGPLTLDTRGHRVWARGAEVALTAKEYALLEFLLHHAGAVVTRADIAEHVWDEHYDVLSNVVDVYVQRLRRKLDVPGAASIIRTRRGEGYELTIESGVAR